MPQRICARARCDACGAERHVWRSCRNRHCPQCQTRAKFLDALDVARRSGQLPDDPEASPAAWGKRHRALLAHDWVVYAKPPPGGPAQVLDYLARYTHRVAISNERILGCDHEHVCIRARDNRSGGKRPVTLPIDTFIGRFLQHVLPRGFKRIRHYGVLAANHKRARLAAARVALQMPEPQPLAIEAAEAFLARISGHDPSRCTRCSQGHWHRIAAIAPPPRCRDGPS